VGGAGLYREPGRPLFDDAELAFVQAVAPSLAEGARRALLVGEATDPEGPDAPGLLVLSDDGEVESATPGVERWLQALPDGDWDAGKLPPSVLAVAGRALRTAEHPDEPGEVAVSRGAVALGHLDRAAWRLPGRRWHPPRGRDRRARPPGPDRAAADVGLWADRTRTGGDPAGAAGQLDRRDRRAAGGVDPHRAQHLKRIFDKTGVRSRRDLVGKVFFAHYEPRVRDNDRRTIEDLPLRGGPFVGGATA